MGRMRSSGGRRGEVREALRARIRAIESGVPAASSVPGAAAEAVPLGVETIDRALPWGGLPRHALHEIAADGAGRPRGAGGAATGFAAVLVGRFCGARGQALWCARRQDLHAPGLSAFGVESVRLLTVFAARAEDVLWTLEEALGCGRFSVVLGEAAAGPMGPPVCCSISRARGPSPRPPP